MLSARTEFCYLLAPSWLSLTPCCIEECSVVWHFWEMHSRSETGHFIVPLPKNPHSQPLSKSKSQAVWRVVTVLKGSISRIFRCYGWIFRLNHAEPVPFEDLKKPTKDTLYLPMYAVQKEQSTTTKITVVFDTSAISSSGVSLNDSILVRLTIHPPLIDVLLQFCSHSVALTADVSKMYCFIELVPNDRMIEIFTDSSGKECEWASP